MTKVKTIVLILIAIAVVYTAIRATTVTNTERALRTEFRDLEDQGIKIRYSSMIEDGFPYRIVFTLKDFQLYDRTNTYAITAGKVDLISHVWTPGHWLVDLYDVRLNLLGGSIDMQSNTLRASYKLQEDGKTTVVLDSQETGSVQVNDFLGLQNPARLNRAIVSALLYPETDPDKGLYAAPVADIRLQAAGVTIGDGQSAHQTIHGFELTGTLTGAGLTRWTDQALKDWSLAGGLFTIDAFNMAIPGAAIGASGSLSTDERLYPLGSLSLQLRGPESWAEILKSGGLVNRKKALQRIRNLPEKSDISLSIQGGMIVLDNELLTEIDPIQP